MANSFTTDTVSPYGIYGGDLNMQGLANPLNQTGIAGRYAPNKEDFEFYKNVYGDPQTAALAYMLDQRSQRESDSQRLKERFDVALPFFQKIGEQSQKFGFQSNLLGAGLTAISKIPETINAMRAIPLQGLYQQNQTTPDIFASYGSGRPGFSGIRTRLGVG